MTTKQEIIDKQNEELKIYRGLLHDIQLHAEVTMNGEKLNQLIGNICRWSYSHRCGNGELSDKEQDALIYRAFLKLRDITD